MRTPPSIGFEYRPSRVLAACTAAMLVLAMMAIALSGIALPFKAALIILAFGYGTIALWRFLHPRVHALTWRGDGGVTIVLNGAGGNVVEVRGELGDARVFGPLIVLALRATGANENLWLLPDNIGADNRRRLRVRLATDGTRHTSVNPDSI